MSLCSDGIPMPRPEVHVVRFRHPGRGRDGAPRGPKGRQHDAAAIRAMSSLLGDGPLRRDLLIEYLHNIQDAAVAVAAAAVAGVDPVAAAGVMASYPGVARRMEIVGEVAGIVVVDDFAHHPTALAATIAAARQQWPDRRLVIAFEPQEQWIPENATRGAIVEAFFSLSR